ncbi:MAG TPA: AsmA-like C-terminal region-containing protein [Planctomycetota bacterium]
MRVWLSRLLIGTAAACLLGLGLLLVFEESGLLARVVERRLARALGPLGERLSLDHAALRWFEPGLELVGLRLEGPKDAAPSALELHRVHLVLSPRLDAVRWVSIEGGRMLLGPRLFDDWNRLATRTSEPGARGDGHMPLVTARDFELGLELFDGSSFELGRLALAARADADGTVELAGRLEPSLGGALVAPEAIRLSGVLSDEGVQVWSAARALALESRALPPSALPPGWPQIEGAARLTLEADFQLVYADVARPSGRIRASLDGGRFRFGSDRPALSDLELELEADLAPPPGGDLWQRESWDGRARLRARVDDAPVLLWAEVGRRVAGTAWLEASGRARGVRIDAQSLAALGLEQPTRFAREMLGPTGRLDLGASVSLGGRADALSHDIAVHFGSDGAAALTYLGVPGEPGTGLPLPLFAVRGEGVAGVHSGQTRPWRLCVPAVTAQHGSGSLAGWMQLLAPAREAGAFPLPELDLELATPSLAVDATLLAALEANPDLAWIRPDFAPANGTLAADLRLRSGPELGGTSAAAEVRLAGVSLRWSEVPVQMDGVSGELKLRWARDVSVVRDKPHLHQRALGVAYELDNRRASGRLGARARVAGWVREPPLPPVFDPAAVPDELHQELWIEIDELGLRGRDFEILAESFPQLEREVEGYGAVGRVRVRFHGAQPSLLLPFRSSIEATPLEVHARPQFFQRQTRDLRGRVLIEAVEDQGGETRAAHFVLGGTWPSGVELFASGTIPFTGEALMHVYGAGIDPDNTSFKGALLTSLAESPTSGGIDLTDWTLAGPVDLALTSRFDPASPAPATNDYQIQLRDNDLRSTDLVLRDLRGTLVQQGDVLTSSLVEATLGGHPLELRDLCTFPLAMLPAVGGADPWLAREGFWSDPNGRALQADVHCRDLPLDAQHLAGLLTPEALAHLRENPDFRGFLDVLGARLVMTSEFDDDGRVAMRGPMRLHDMSLQLGLPIEVRTAEVDLREMVLESERFRGWAEIAGMDASLAERRLSSARMIAGYVDGRLTIDNLSGDFEGGRLESLGGAGGGSSKALGIDLFEPHRFDVAMRISDANVESLMRGVFQSSIADEGKLDATLQLSGRPDDVLGLTGQGTLALDEGALWSIPVIRVLFAQLGFEKGGLFDRLRSRFELRDGRVQVSHLEIQSALMNLVGRGWQDLDGELAYDLEVRYALLDRLGPVGRLLYWLNNSLMRVAVRGDFERPEVAVRNSILELVKGFDDRPPRSLPLPKFSPLGPRF